MVLLAGSSLSGDAGIITNPLAQKLGYKKIIKENFPRSTGGWEAESFCKHTPRDLHNESKLLLGRQWAQWARESQSACFSLSSRPRGGGPQGRTWAGAREERLSPGSWPPLPSMSKPENASQPWRLISSSQKVKDALVTDGERTVRCLLANVSPFHRPQFAA